jgi:succinate dehydrogenase / fumarate reductase flavoprotein subunit/fumarate reductase (CoM/CoB) subunit A
MQDFTDRYGVPEDGKYVITRDVGTYAIIKEVEAGRGTPHGGAYLSFTHCTEAALREAFGPVIDRLAANDIDLTKMPVEVAPIAHYHMGGVVADAQMRTEVAGLFVAGEVAGGANGANRLSGNAVTEALVFGWQAGRSAAQRSRQISVRTPAAGDIREAIDLIAGDSRRQPLNTAAMIERLQATMAEDVGPLRTQARLTRALASLDGLAAELGARPPSGGAFDLQRLEWFDLRNMLMVARSVTTAALRRAESRGAHQREDFPGMLTQWQVNQFVSLHDDALTLSGEPAMADT